MLILDALVLIVNQFYTFKWI